MPHAPAFCAPTSLPLRTLTPLPRTSAPRATYRVPCRASPGPQGLIFCVAPSPPPPSQAAPPESAAPPPQHRLTAAARARTVVHVCASGTLCTASARHGGVAFGSHADLVLDAAGRPVFLLARNATHTRNLSVEPRASLYCQPPSSAGQDGCRATLVGEVVPLPEAEAELREAYLHLHAHAADALVYPDLFAFYRMEVRDVFFVGGYGVVSQWVDAATFAAAQPDPLAFDAAAIVAGINTSKEDDLKRLCKVFLQVPDVQRCTMTALDRLGFDLRVRDAGGEIREYRVAFRERVCNRFDVQSALVKAFQEAWERENGYDETWAGEDARPTVLYYAPL